MYRFGQSFDMLGLYFVGRFLIRSWSDVKFVGKVLAVLSLPVAVLFTIEWATAYNVFSIFGGVPAETWVRSGRLRCQGAFAHPILAGTFWAAALPLIWTLRKDKNFLMRLGTIGCLFIVAACSSSTPILVVLVAVTGVALFPWRRHRTKMWVGLFVLLSSLHAVMEAPVWALMQRVDLTGGSTGWHRYQLFDAFVNHFSEWWLLGEPDPMSWGVWVMRDPTNVYVSTGLTGGLLTLIVLLLVLIFAFGNVGRVLKMSSIARSPKRQWICWCIGVAICVHAVTFLGASYFGQMIVMLYLELALASCVYVFAIRDSRKQRAKTRVLEAQRPRNEISEPIPSQSGPGGHQSADRTCQPRAVGSLVHHMTTTVETSEVTQFVDTHATIRFAWGDYIRVFGTLAVISQHIAHGTTLFGASDVSSVTWWGAMTVEASCRWAVPVFVMLSGALLLDPVRDEAPSDFYRKRFWRIGIPLLFWSLFYTLPRAAANGFDAPVMADIGTKLAHGRPAYHMYFLFVIAGLYLFTPYLRIIVRSVSCAELRTVWVALILIAWGGNC